MTHTIDELTWLSFILQDLGMHFTSIPTLFCDYSLHMTINPIMHARSKYIELDYHYVCEHVALDLLLT